MQYYLPTASLTLGLAEMARLDPFLFATHPAVATLLTRAATADIRHDITPEDILRTTVGLCYTHDRPSNPTCTAS